MEKIKIFVGDDSEYSEINSIDGGSRPDVIVKIGDALFHPIVYDIYTLTQEFNNFVANGEVYNIDNNIILVKEVSKKEIIRTILYLYENKYFDRVKPIDLEEEYAGCFELCPHMKTLAGWVQIY